MAITKQDALDYHQGTRPGKIEVVSTKPCLTQRDLSLAYTPGVADALPRNREEPAGCISGTPPRATWLPW